MALSPFAEIFCVCVCFHPFGKVQVTTRNSMTSSQTDLRKRRRNEEGEEAVSSQLSME